MLNTQSHRYINICICSCVLTFFGAFTAFHIHLNVFSAAVTGDSCKTVADCPYGHICKVEINDDGTKTGMCVHTARRLKNVLRDVSSNPTRKTKRVIDNPEHQKASTRRLHRLPDVSRSTYSGTFSATGSMKTALKNARRSGWNTKLSRASRLQAKNPNTGTGRTTVRRDSIAIKRSKWSRRAQPRFAKAMSGTVAASTKRETIRRDSLNIARKKWAKRNSTRFNAAHSGSTANTTTRTAERKRDLPIARSTWSRRYGTRFKTESALHGSAKNEKRLTKLKKNQKIERVKYFRPTRVRIQNALDKNTSTSKNTDSSSN